MLKLTEKTCWDLVQGAAGQRPCATWWLIWLKEPQGISCSSWLEVGRLWYRMWKEWVKSLQKNSWSPGKKKKKKGEKTNHQKTQLKNRKTDEKKCLITIPVSFKMLCWAFRLSDSSKIPLSWGQSLLVMSIKHFSLWCLLPVGRQYGIYQPEPVQELERVYSQPRWPAGSLWRSYFSLCLSVFIGKRRIMWFRSSL